MTRILVLVGGFLLVITTSALPAYYKYVDRDGVVTVTNDFSSIPKELRNSAEKVKLRNSPEPARELAPMTGSDNPSPVSGSRIQAEQVFPEQPPWYRTHQSGFILSALILLAGFAGSLAVGKVASRSENAGFAGLLRSGLLCGVIAGIFLVNQDLLKIMLGKTVSKGADLKMKVEEQREKDRKPLKSLEEVVMEKMK